MNEREFVQYLKKNFPFSYGQGIGDDTSSTKRGAGHQLITNDILIENIHFKLDYFTLQELALKSLAVNISDITAMGGQAEYYYLGLGFPEKFLDTGIQQFFSGIQRGNQKWNLELAGGDFSKSGSLFISVTMVGKATKPVYRRNAQKNDLIGITGITGDSALGLMLLKNGITDHPLVKKHKCPEPEIDKGLILAKYVHAMIDVSDGLLLDLKRILDESSKGAIINYHEIPIPETTKSICYQYGIDEREVILAGGEDYKLLFTLSPQEEKKLSQEPLNYYLIGKITPSSGTLLVEERGKAIEIKKMGFDHFNSKG